MLGKTKRVELRISPLDAAVLNRVAKATGLSMSEAIREAVRRWDAQLRSKR